MTRLLRLLALYRPIYAWMALGVMLSLLTILANVTLMATSGWFITSMALAGVAGVTMNYFTPAAMIRGAAMLRTGGRYAERLVTHDATLQLLARLRTWFYEKLEPLAPAALQGHHSGDLLSRIQADIDTLDNLYLRLLVPVSTALLGSVVLTLFLASYDPAFAAVLFGGLLTAGLFVPLIVGRLARRPGEQKVALMAQQRRMLVDSTQGLGELLLYGTADVHLQKIRTNSDALAAQQARIAGINGLSQAALLLLANLAMWAILWLAIPMVEAGTLPKADLAMLALFSLAAFEAVMPLPGALQAYGETLAAANRLFEIIDLEPTVEQVDNPIATSGKADAPLQIVFSGIRFSYPGQRSPALEDIQLTIPYGSRHLVRGPSGSGKSSLLQLLLRFHDPQQGAVSLGGVDLKDWDIEQLRSKIAVASQEAHIFTGTLRENLLLARPDADEPSLKRACEIAQLDEFIATQPQGLDTWIGEAGNTLSGGQARRLSLARAILKDSPILVLDEPTEGLDPSTADKLLRAIDGATLGKTLIVITHLSLSGIRFDTESILRNGRLVSAH